MEYLEKEWKELMKQVAKPGIVRWWWKAFVIVGSLWLALKFGECIGQLLYSSLH